MPILEEIARNKERWHIEVTELSAGPKVKDWKQQAEALRKKLAAMTPPKPEHSAPVDAKGVLTGTRDPKLDGPYDGVRDLIRRRSWRWTRRMLTPAEASKKYLSPW